MRILALETRNFGRLPDGRIEFAEGLTVLSGPNEAGKSFTIRAIYAGLFDEAVSEAKERQILRKWGEDGTFEVTLEMDCGDGIIRLERDLEKRKAVLTKPDGTQVTDKKSVQKLVGQMLGLPSLKSFQATACVLQDSVRELDPEKAGLKQLIGGELGGAGKETDALLKKLDKKIKEIKPPRAAGKLGALEADRDRYAVELERLRGELDSLVSDKAELERAEQDLLEKGNKYKDLEAAYKGAKEYREADTACDGATAVFNTAEQNLKDWRDAQTGAGEARRRLDEIAPQLQALAVHADLDAAQREEEALQERFSASSSAGVEIEKLEARLKGLPRVAETSLKRAKDLAGEIDAKQGTLAEQLFGIEVEAESSSPFNITIDGAAWDGTSGTAHHKATVEFPGVGVVRIENMTAGVPELAEKLDGLQTEFAGLLRKYNAQDLSALEELSREYHEVAGCLEAEQRRQVEALGGLSPEELQAEVRRSAEEVVTRQAAWDALGKVFGTEEDLEAARANSDSLQQEEGDLKQSLAGHTAILQHLGDEAGLIESRDKAFGDLAIARSKRDAVSMYECDLEAFAGLERRHGELLESLAELRRQRDQVSFRVGAATVGEEDLAKAEESFAEVEGKIARLTHRKQLLETVAAGIRKAREETIDQFSPGLAKRMGEVLARITEGKYDRVSIDGELEVSVYSPEKSEWLEMEDDRSLSTGTKDQVFLAARIALLEQIAGEAHPPLIMDDTFASFDDMGRKQRAFEVLTSLAERNQILYFTCQGCPDDLSILNLG